MDGQQPAAASQVLTAIVNDSEVIDLLGDLTVAADQLVDQRRKLRDVGRSSG